MTSYARIAALVMAAGVLAVGAIACGDDGDAEPTTTATSVAPTVAAVTETTDVTETPGIETLTIIASDFAFNPDTTEATVAEVSTCSICGPSIVSLFILQNDGTVKHTLTVYTDEEFSTALEGADTGQVSPSAESEFEVVFTSPGTYYFRCEVHPTLMQGEIKVS